jgi:hypothetical protein
MHHETNCRASRPACLSPLRQPARWPKRDRSAPALAPLRACLCAPWLRVRVACVPAPLPAFACAHRPAGVPACVRALGPAPLRVCAPARMMRARVASFVPALAPARVCAGGGMGECVCGSIGPAPSQMPNKFSFHFRHTKDVATPGNEGSVVGRSV